MPTLFITGANRGIGLELTKQYLTKDWKVIATCRSPKNATRLSVLLDKYPENLTVYPLDVGNHENIADLKNTLGDIAMDLLVNNAGIYCNESNHFGNLDVDSWLEAFKVNAISPIKIIEAFIDNVERSNEKIIANISSKMGSIADNTFGGRYAYRSSKSALNSASVSAARELIDKNITVVLLHPGWVRTDMGGSNGELSVEESATSLIKTLSTISIQDSGKFFDIDGSIIPW